MTLLLMIIIVVFFLLCVFMPMIEERKERKAFNKWAEKAYYEFDVDLPLFKKYCESAKKRYGNYDVAHNAYLIAAEEWYDLNCK